MLKIKLIKGQTEEEIEYKINSFLEGPAKAVLEVNVQQIKSSEYLASILYQEIGRGVGQIPSCHNLPKVETVLLNNKTTSSLPFDKLSSGDSLGNKD